MTRGGRILLPLVLVLDSLLLVAAVVALVVMLTGGGVFTFHGIHVSALRARNPLTIMLALAALRLVLHRAGPFLSIDTLDTAELPAEAARLAERVCRRLRDLTPRAAVWTVASLLVASLLLRFANAWYYYGFFSGDDVEIHEMTFSVLFGKDSPIWDLRSPFFPMTFVFPAQWLAVTLGFEGTAVLVFVGRAVVAVWSCVGLGVIYVVGRRLMGGPAGGLVAALLLAVTRLHVRLGSSELPRAVSATFLIVAFGLLFVRPRSTVWAALSGVALGTAAAMRFSEVVFVLPLCVQLLAERRLRDLAVASSAAGATAAAILGLGDLLYWGDAFHSLSHIVDFTLVQQASSRGVEPLHHYLTTAFRWSNGCMLVLFGAGMRRQWKAALWTLLPILALSLLPHKEERYLVPVLPFMALVAAAGVSRLLNAVREGGGRHQRWAPYVLLLVAGALLLELEGGRCRRSEGAVDIARHLARIRPNASVAIEQPWRAGSRLYLRDARIVDLAPGRLDEATSLWGVVRRRDLDFIMLRPRADSTPWQEEVLRRAGFRRVPVPGASRDADWLYERFRQTPSAQAH